MRYRIARFRVRKNQAAAAEKAIVVFVAKVADEPGTLAGSRSGRVHLVVPLRPLFEGERSRALAVGEGSFDLVAVL